MTTFLQIAEPPHSPKACGLARLVVSIAKLAAHPDEDDGGNDEAVATSFFLSASETASRSRICSQ